MAENPLGEEKNPLFVAGERIVDLAVWVLDRAIKVKEDGFKITAEKIFGVPPEESNQPTERSQSIGYPPES